MKKIKQNEALIVQSNSLIEGQYKLPTFAQILIRKLISMISLSDNKLEKRFYSVTVKDIGELTGRKDSGSLYRDIKKASDILQRQIIVVRKNNQSWLKTTWLSSAEYFHGEGRFEFEFSSKLEGELLKLRQKFTEYYLKNIASLSSQYSIRLYELLKQYLPLKYRVIKITELKPMLGIGENQYERFHSFRTKVLEQAKTELSKKTNIAFTWSPIKTGRKITAIKFEIEAIGPIDKDKKTNSIPLYIIELIPKNHCDDCIVICEKIINERDDGENCLKWLIEYVNGKKYEKYGAYLRFAYEKKLYDNFLEQQKLEKTFILEQEEASANKKNEQLKLAQADEKEIKREDYLNALINSLSPEEEEELNQIALEMLESDSKIKKGSKNTLERYWKYFNGNKKDRAIKCLYQYRLKLIEAFKAKEICVS